MPALPNPPSRGEQILPWAMRVTEYLRFLTPRGAGVRNGSSGATYARRVGTSPQATLAVAPNYRPFEISAGSSGGASPELRVEVHPSTIAGMLPPGMTAVASKLLSPLVGDREIYAFAVGNISTGAASSVALVDRPAGSPPDGSETDKYTLLGGYFFDGSTGALTCNNVAFGPVTLESCQDVYVSPVTYSFTALRASGG